MAMGIDLEAFETEGGVYRFFTENIEDIHLYSDIDNFAYIIEPGIPTFLAVSLITFCKP